MGRVARGGRRPGCHDEESEGVGSADGSIAVIEGGVDELDEDYNIKKRRYGPT